MNILLSLLYWAQMAAREIQWLLYRDKVTAKGKVFMNLGSGILGNTTPKQVVLGKCVRLSGWLTILGKGKITIGDYTLIGARSVIQAWDAVTLGSYVMISPDVWIQDNNSHSIFAQDRLVDILGSRDFNPVGLDTTNAAAKSITIGDHVWIGRRAIILKGVTIGDRAVVGAGSVITQDVPADTVVAGNPAKPVKGILTNPVDVANARATIKERQNASRQHTP